MLMNTAMRMLTWLWTALISTWKKLGGKLRTKSVSETKQNGTIEQLLTQRQTVAAYQPDELESFHVSLEDGVALVLAQSKMPSHLFGVLFALGFVYAPVVLLVSSIDHATYSYSIAQWGDSIDLDAVLGKLQQFEHWQKNNEGELTSPFPSIVPQSTILELLTESIECLPEGTAAVPELVA